jgi:catechol 2,3-dioxygenase-like lactoylglutathione lyase family enzyme
MERAITEDDRVEVLPILPSLDIAETRDFYRDHLGFDTVGYEAQDYLILSRLFAGQRMKLHFWLADDRALCEKSASYIRGGGIDALHAEFTARKLPNLTPMTIRPWNMEEFYVFDPHGNLLKFGRIPAA